jgi:ribosomal protein S18 acetylase RimI-like enzyme
MDEMASIRTATQEDAPSIARVQIETWRTNYRGIVADAYLAGLDVEQRTIRWREHLESHDRVLVAEQGCEVVGFISGGAIRESLDGYDAELYAIYLLLKTQRRGIGTTLLIELARRLVDDGFERMAAWVLQANAAVRFYERSGAVCVAAKEREIGGASLPLAAYGWPDLKRIAVFARDH